MKQNKVFEWNREKLSLVRRLSPSFAPKQCTKAIFIFISISFLSIEQLNDAWRNWKLKNWILRLKWHLSHSIVHWIEDGTFAISGFRKMQFIDSSDVKWTNEIFEMGETKRAAKVEFEEWGISLCSSSIDGREPALNYWRMSLCRWNDAEVKNIWFNAPWREVTASAYYSLFLLVRVTRTERNWNWKLLKIKHKLIMSWTEIKFFWAIWCLNIFKTKFLVFVMISNAIWTLKIQDLTWL